MSIVEKRGIQMFKDNLSEALLKLIEEKNITQEKLAEASNLSFRYVNKIIGRKSSPTITSLEKICSAYDITPNELLLPADSDKANAKPVTQIDIINTGNSSECHPVCPHCGKILKAENIAFCNHCSGKLSWQNYYKSTLITDKSQNRNERKI